jgi:hypothetical protein
MKINLCFTCFFYCLKDPQYDFFSGAKGYVFKGTEILFILFGRAFALTPSNITPTPRFIRVVYVKVFHAWSKKRAAQATP